MASGKDYLNFILEQCAGLEGLRYRAMMGEYILYCRGKLVGGIYDDRLLVKPTPSACRLLLDAPLVQPYPGAKELLLVEELDDRVLLRTLFTAIADELPAPKSTKA